MSRFGPVAIPTLGAKEYTYVCKKFHQNISIFTQVIACTDGRTDGRTDSQLDFNSSRHPDHLYMYIYIQYITLYLSRLVLGDTDSRSVIFGTHSIN